MERISSRRVERFNRRSSSESTALRPENGSRIKEALIDTDILSYFFKGDIEIIEKVREYLNEHPRLNISILTKYEVIGGLEYKNAIKQLEEFDKFLDKCDVVNLSDKSIRISAKVYGILRRSGITISTSDLLIAGIALEKNWQLITNNEKHYKNVEGLEINNWKK